MKPLVTVLMATYNDAAYLRTCIRSVLNQSYAHLEFIIVDDASMDSTPRIVRSFHDPRIRYIRLSNNSGKGKAMNTGLKQAKGKYILEIDGDDWLPRNTVNVLVKAMIAASPSIAVIYTDKRKWFLRSGKWVKGGPYKGVPFRSRADWALRFRTFGARFYRTSALRRIHGWPTHDASGGRLYEDYAVMLKLLDHYRFKYLPRNLYNVRIRPQSTSRRQKRAKWKKIVGKMAKGAFKRWGILSRYKIR